MNLDGNISSDETVVSISTNLNKISGIAVDHRENILYWAEKTLSSNVIMYLNMSEWLTADMVS
jgi:hypothetical protein